MTYRILFINPKSKKAAPVGKLLEVIALTIRSRYTCQLDPGEPGRGSLGSTGVGGLEFSRDVTGEYRGEAMACNSCVYVRDGDTGEDVEEI